MLKISGDAWRVAPSVLLILVAVTFEVAAQEQPVAVVVDLEGDGLADYEFVRRALRSVGLSTPVLGFPAVDIDSEHQPNRPAPVKESARPRLEALAAARKRFA